MLNLPYGFIGVKRSLWLSGELAQGEDSEALKPVTETLPEVYGRAGDLHGSPLIMGLFQ